MPLAIANFADYPRLRSDATYNSVPESVTSGLSELVIEIRPMRVGWTAFRYELWGLP